MSRPVDFAVLYPIDVPVYRRFWVCFYDHQREIDYRKQIVRERVIRRWEVKAVRFVGYITEWVPLHVYLDRQQRHQHFHHQGRPHVSRYSRRT